MTCLCTYQIRNQTNTMETIFSYLEHKWAKVQWLAAGPGAVLLQHRSFSRLLYKYMYNTRPCVSQAKAPLANHTPRTSRDLWQFTQLTNHRAIMPTSVGYPALRMKKQLSKMPILTVVFSQTTGRVRSPSRLLGLAGGARVRPGESRTDKRKTFECRSLQRDKRKKFDFRNLE